jgi:hypothetical protein
VAVEPKGGGDVFRLPVDAAPLTADSETGSDLWTRRIAEVPQTGVTKTLFGRERPIPDI